jgi:hypothetical protein
MMPLPMQKKERKKKHNEMEFWETGLGKQAHDLLLRDALRFRSPNSCRLRPRSGARSVANLDAKVRRIANLGVKESTLTAFLHSLEKFGYYKAQGSANSFGPHATNPAPHAGRRSGQSWPISCQNADARNLGRSLCLSVNVG